MNNLTRVHDKIVLLINSCGGCVSDGIAIIQAMEASKVPIVTIALGEIKSMAFDIFVAGNERIIAPTTIAMAHPLSLETGGTTHDHRTYHKYIELMHSHHVKHLKKYTQLDEQTINELFLGKQDFFLTAKDCIKYGVADKISSKFL